MVWLVLVAAAGKPDDRLQIVHYDPNLSMISASVFPMRVQHFASVNKAIDQLGWHPKFDLISGLKDSFQNDYLISRHSSSGFLSR